jgi:outer membrane protein assembly factor BamB
MTILSTALLLHGTNQSAKAKTVSEIINNSGITGGLIVQIGCGDGQSGVALRASDRYFVHSFDADSAKVAKARRTVRDAGLSASVWVDHLDGSRLPFAENMVNLLISENLGKVTMEEVMRVLVPNGIARIKQDGKWISKRKSWPLEIDEWTHWLHGPDGNAVAADIIAGPPRRLKWIAAPLWSRSHDSVPSVTSMVSANGRLFYIVDEAPASMSGAAPDKWALVARDAFNGLELWRIGIDEWGWRAWAKKFTVRFTIPTHMPRRLVAAADRVYVTLGFNAPLTELDAGTGEILRTFEGTQFTDEILCVGGRLIVAINKDRQEPGDKSGSPEPVRKWVAAIDAASGNMLWKTGDYVGLRSKTGPMERISHLSMAAGDGRVFFVDGDRIISLNLADGSEAWKIPRPVVPENKMRYNIRITDMCSMVYSDGMVYFAQLDPDREIDWREIRGRLHALSAATGKELWSRECSSWGWGHPADVFVMDGLVWISGFKDDFYYALDPKSGDVKRRVSNKKAFDNAHHHRCYRNKATPRYIMTSFRGLEFIDTNGNDTSLNHWVRGTCRLGAIPCNGMVYSTPHPCDCYITSKLNGFTALLPAPEDKAVDASPSPRLEKGPAYNQIDNSQSTTVNPNDWPMYRHDRQRSGSTTTNVPAELEPLWQADLKEELISPVVSDGRVIVALQDSRQVVALNRTKGRELWRFTAGGRIDTPPTIHKGRAVFGCADGHVYCLTAEDGRLIWRFRASPDERLIGAFGKLESAWPVHGSVLVQSDTVYCTAGRSSFLDGGIYAWALNLETGDVISRERLSSDHDMEIAWGRDQTVDTGVLSDLLVSYGDGIYLRQRPLFDTARQMRISEQLRSTAGFLDDSWFHRTRWFLGGAPYAEYLVFSAKGVFGVRARKKIGGYGGHFTPGTEGFELFAADLVEPKSRKPAQQAASRPRVSNWQSGRPRGPSQTPTVRKPADRWSIRIPVRATAMALAGDKLFVAGTDDVLYPDDPWAAYEGRKGGKLMAVSTTDGRKLAEYDLSAAPVFDGMAAAYGRIYLSARGGKLTCYAGK